MDVPQPGRQASVSSLLWGESWECLVVSHDVQELFVSVAEEELASWGIRGER